MPLAEIAPRPDIAAGTYEGVVTNVTKDTIVPRTGKNAGKDVPILRWDFDLDGIDESVDSITGRDPSSEKSNLFRYFVAMLGNDRAKWATAEVGDLVGKRVLVTISIDDGGYAKVDAVTAMPVRRAEAAPAPAPQVETGLIEPDDLPF